MSGECEICGDHTLDCTCDGDFREAYQRMNQYWSKAEIDMRFSHLNAKIKPLDDTAIDPPSEKPQTKWIDVKGRKEHEALLMDEEKMISLGLDPMYEKIVYLKRWEGWLKDE